MRAFPMLLCLCVLLTLGPAAVSAQEASDYAIRGVPFNAVTLNDAFWSPRVETNRTVTIPSAFRKCEETGRLENFVLAARKTGKFLTKFPFDDTDPYKIIEGASYSLAVHPDPVLDRYVDSVIALIAAAQEPDGYLYTARTINPREPHAWSGSERWVNESIGSHELYNSGHLFEAAAAHFLATGKKSLLDIALKNADLLTQVFGPGKRNDAPGHEIVEMGLVRLYRVTGERKYLDLAKFFIDCRGKKIDSTRTYWQDQEPVIRQDEAVGHAVRAGYLYSGVADVAALTGDRDYIRAIDRIWENAVTKKLYITGGVGAVPDGERFGRNYELPNLTAYNETCAAIANVYWNFRMFLLHGDSAPIDVLERSLYNNVASGVSLDGKSFFYANPLACDGRFAFNVGAIGRQPWFDCSCCPTNLCRFLPSIPGYIYAQRRDSLYVNLFIGSSATVTVGGKTSVGVRLETRYPWDGAIRLQIDPEKNTQFTLLLRIPGWATNQPVPGDLYAFLDPGKDPVSIRVNGKAVHYSISKGYACLTRKWKKGDRIDYDLPMTIHRVTANAHVASDRGKIALERGPIVYCLEGNDNAKSLDNLLLPDTAAVSAAFLPDLLHGVEVLKTSGLAYELGTDGLSIRSKAVPLTAIPYYSWDNRGADRMKVWIPRRLDEITVSHE